MQKNKVKEKIRSLCRGREVRSMHLAAKIILILLFIIIAGAAVYFRNKSRRREEKGSPDKRNPALKPSEEDARTWRELYSKAQRLEQEMILLTGGKTGMVILKDYYLEAKGNVKEIEYQRSLMMKQEKLRELYNKYYELKKMQEKFTGSADTRIKNLRNEALYTELLNDQY